MKCHICDRDMSTFVDEKSNITYHHCHQCAYISKSPEHFQDFTYQKERYNLHENDENDEGYRAYFQRFLDFVLPHVGKPSSALDFGCGVTSLLAKMLQEEGIACDYYDPIYHPENLDKNKKYQLIVSTEVFEHLHQPREVFTSLLSQLEDGGYLAIQTQFHPNDQVVFNEWYYRHDPTHIVFFTAQTFRTLSKMYGCEFVSENGKNMVLIRKP